MPISWKFNCPSNPNGENVHFSPARKSLNCTENLGFYHLLGGGVFHFFWWILSQWQRIMKKVRVSGMVKHWFLFSACSDGCLYRWGFDLWLKWKTENSDELNTELTLNCVREREGKIETTGESFSTVLSRENFLSHYARPRAGGRKHSKTSSDSCHRLRCHHDAMRLGSIYTILHCLHGEIRLPKK